MELEARADGCNRFFVTTAATREQAIRSISSDISRLQSTGMPEDQITQYILFVVNGLALQLYNMPIDMVIEQRIYERFPTLRPSQVASLYSQHQDSLQALEDPNVQSHAPREIWRANVTLNCAMALFVDHLYAGKTAFAEPYHEYKMFGTGQKLFGAWQDAMHDFHPGDEYDLVDEYAKILRLQRWYEWAPDAEDWARSKDEDLEPPSEGITDPELLKEKEPASVMYCLDALQRFDIMLDDQVRGIAFEIALLGRSGLDYSSSDKKYTLNSIPGERFSGLQIMCLMFVGFKRIEPTLDTGMDLENAYQTALTLHKGRK